MRFTFAALALAAASAFNPAVAAMGNTVYFQDFESGSAGFAGSAGAVVGSQSLGSGLFGGNVFYNDGIPAVSTLTLTFGQALGGVNLSLSLAIVDSWDDNLFCCGPDTFTISLNGNTVYSAVFDNYRGVGANGGQGLTNFSYGSNLFGNSGFNDATYNLNVNLGNVAAGTHTITFTASGPGWQGGGDESFAIDNIAVTAAVPEPYTWAMLAAGVACIGMVGTRRKRAAPRLAFARLGR